jgi:hypothetical protein
MMIYTPYADVAEVARAHPLPMLFRQRLNIHIIHRALTLRGKQSKWLNHPVAWMWKGYEGYLLRLGNAMEREITTRVAATDAPRIRKRLFSLPHYLYDAKPVSPWWLTTLCHNHKSLLIRRDPGHYEAAFKASMNPAELLDETPIWPVSRDGTRISGVSSGDEILTRVLPWF